MDKINFQNLPSTDTPLSAENMNLLQTNIENGIKDAGVVVNSTEPTTDKKRVWIKHSENYYNGQITDLSVNQSSSFTLTLKPNTNYTMYSNIPQDIGSALLFIITGTSTSVTTANNGVWGGNPRTMPTDANGKITIAYRRLSSDIADLTTFYYKIEEGSNITQDTEYVLNSNNTYEEINTNNVVVSNIEPQGNDRKEVWLRHSQNLADIQNLGLMVNTNGTVVSNGAAYDIIIDVSNVSYIYINGDFSLLGDTTLRIGKFSSYPVLNSSGTRIGITSGQSIDVSSTNYVLLAFLPADGVTDWLNKVNQSFMINLGSTALPYEPYVTDKTYILDNDNIYREYAPQQEIYSTEEIVIGTYLGKPLYRKTINSGTLPNATDKYVAHNISNLDKVVKLYGYANRPNVGTLILPYASKGGVQYTIELGTNDTSIIIGTGYNRTSYTESYVVIEYTKTTD